MQLTPRVQGPSGNAPFLSYSNSLAMPSPSWLSVESLTRHVRAGFTLRPSDTKPMLISRDVYYPGHRCTLKSSPCVLLGPKCASGVLDTDYMFQSIFSSIRTATAITTPSILYCLAQWLSCSGILLFSGSIFSMCTSCVVLTSRHLASI